MEPKRKWTLPVIDMNSEGVGICKQDGMVVFVPDTVTGDVVCVQITDQQKNYAMGQCLEVVTPSQSRIEPDCPCYHACGGCTLRHVSREMELSVKENTVRQALRRMHLTIAEGDVRPILSTDEYGYRNKAVFHAVFSQGGKNGAIGYYAKESHTIMPGSIRCHLLPSLFGDIADYTAKWMLGKPVAPLSLYLRQNQMGQTTVALQTAEDWQTVNQEVLFDYAKELTASFPQVTGVLHSDSPKGKYAVPTYTVLCGERYLWEEYGVLRMRISPEGFCQVNKAGAMLLAGTVLSFAGTVTEETAKAADLYCGSGFFGLQLAKAFPKWQLFGIEINPDSIRDAQVNRDENGLTNIQFQTGDAAIAQEGYDVVVIDPPRAGCSDKMRRQLLHLAPKKIVYVSCNPQTLARDLAALVQGGYRIEAVQPVDMFPRTGHVETVCLLSKLQNGQHMDTERLV